MIRLRPAAALAALLACACFAAPLHAQDDEVMSAEQIQRALNPPRERSIVIDDGATTTNRQIEVRPSIALRVEFGPGSARLTAEGMAQLDELARALQSPELAQKRYAIDGHTDAKGSAAANLRMSERRAEAVKRYLVEQYGVDGARLETHGYGFTRLLDPANPYAAVNRRVEISEALP